jgi:predicted transcriptional regulator
MNLETRKLKIINWVSRLKDEAIIEKIENLQSHRRDWWNLIDEDEKKEIEDGILQADKGELKTTEEVMSKYKKWL